MKAKQTRAWLYTRIDAPEDSGGALKAQERELRGYAEQAGLSVAGCSSDTGTEHFAVREGFCVMLIAAERGDFDALIIRDLARLAPVGESLGMLRHLQKHGVTVLSPLEGNLTAKLGGGANA
jgi:DNA invertase Pin-like site-specific DNA recombinase